jgi:hypothetical protein
MTTPLQEDAAPGIEAGGVPLADGRRPSNGRSAWEKEAYFQAMASV